MIKAIVWDIGGVLVEDPKFKEFWKNKSGSKELRDNFGSGNLPLTDFIKECSKLLGMSSEEFINKYNGAYLSLKLISGSFNIFKKFKGINYLFADTNPVHIKYIKEKFPELFANCNKAFLSTDIGYRKSNPETLKFILSKINAKPEEILLIDNNIDIIQKAKKLKIKTIHYNPSINLMNEIDDKITFS